MACHVAPTSRFKGYAAPGRMHLDSVTALLGLSLSANEAPPIKGWKQGRKEGGSQQKKKKPVPISTVHFALFCSLLQAGQNKANTNVHFLGEYHLDLIVSYGAVPVIVPRVAGVHMLLESFEPIHGVLLCEGEDIDPSLYDSEMSSLSQEEMEEIRRLHESDTSIDREKDSIELSLAKLCLERNIPYLGICRGSQILNVACGGTLYQDVEKELLKKNKGERVVHIDYDNYDGHRHLVNVVENTPLHSWFRCSLEEGKMELEVNSYHHQGVKRLAERFIPMAFAPDGLIEGFYDPDAYNPEEGKFIMGLQFHPERMRKSDSDEFDYPGCPAAYQEFVKAVRAYLKKVNSSVCKAEVQKLDKEMENKRKMIVRSFSIARDVYESGVDIPQSKQSELEAGAEFLESNTALSLLQEKRLKQMGATVRNASSYIERLKMNEEREVMAKAVMGKMSIDQLSELLSFYCMMEKICSEVLERKLISNTALSLLQEKRLKQMGATVRNASSYIERLKMNEEREVMAKAVMGKMSIDQLSELLSLYRLMEKICSEVLERKLTVS
ncbi:hypothetical protein ACLOJK_033071 [Asimina triloba]